jgi:ADP-ribose pyrophosphatase YjhB (NUDIX family)
MEFRARAAAIILNENNELLLVLHKHPRTGEQWWTLPGGGLEMEECAENAVIREVKEECYIDCTPGRLVYVREFIDEDNDRHYIELFFLAEVISYDVRTGYDPELTEQYIMEARFLNRKEIQSTSISVFPEVLRDRFWDDLESGFFGHISYLGQHRFKKVY